MTEADREQFAARLRRVQASRFHGQAKAAYTAAGVNPETWRRATAGESVKPHTISTIVTRLWPEAGGDWAAVADGDAQRGPLEERFSRAMLRDVSNDDLLSELARRLHEAVEESASPVRAHAFFGSRISPEDRTEAAHAGEQVARDEAARQGVSSTRSARSRQDAEATLPDDPGAEAGA